MSGPEVTTMSAFDYKDQICPALSKASDAGASGDVEAYSANVDTAAESSEAFLKEYPANDHAAALLEFSELLRDLPPEGLTGQDLVDAQALMSEVGRICGTKP